MISVWRVEVAPKSESLDVPSREVLGDIHRFGFEHVRAVRSCRIYLLQGNLDRDMVDDLARAVLCDPVSEVYACAPDSPDWSGTKVGRVPPAAPPARAAGETRPTGDGAIEVHYRPGVMDPVALSARRALNERIAALNPPKPMHVTAARTARRYTITGARNAEELEQIALGVLANTCIETVCICGFDRRDRRLTTMPEAPVQPFELRTVAIRKLDGPELERLSRKAHLFLSRMEMEVIRDHFRALGREPTDLELDTLAQAWSEHCAHKTLKSAVIYRGDDFGREGEVEVYFDNLFESTIARATSKLNRDWCWSVFEDNAGVVAFDDDCGIAFKVETHNHPSAIEPYGGAATGIGGCIRDIMGCGLGAKPIASTDVFCVAPPDYPRDRLPRGVLHPARVLKGVVAGVGDYGNRMGVPTVNGAVHFDERYLANPLVFCGTVGLIPRKFIHKGPKPGDRIVLVGGRTGRDGIHGATFSSAELTESHPDEFSHAVQIGNPIEQKKVLDALLQARDHRSGCLYRTITDCGAGGLSNAVGEMGAKLGAVVDLEKVPLKYAGLRYDEIWVSEAQERMVLAVPPERLDTLLTICQAEDVEVSTIGWFTDDRRLVVRYAGTVVGDLQMSFVHEGLPKITRRATWTAPNGKGPALKLKHPGDLSRELPARLRSYNVASKEWIIRRYDHEVQGGSVVKPLCGPGAGPSDAAVFRPLLDGWRGVAIACGLCPHVSDRDPYWMAIRAVDEALRNLICVGADPSRVAILDNFCWGACDTPEALGALARACKGASDAAVAFGLPFISGKDSLNNQFSQTSAQARRLGLPETITIPGTLLISGLGIIEDVRQCVTMDLKRPGHPIALVACPADGMGLERAFVAHNSVSRAIRAGGVSAAHDISDGGLAVALAEMCIAGNLGLRVDLGQAYGDDPAARLFEEYPTGYILECASGDIIRGVGGVKLGEVTQTPELVITSGGKPIIELEVEVLARAWREPFTHVAGGCPTSSRFCRSQGPKRAP
ncbi:MAG: phosphoribosylformylglycinamidine synthase subunit PurS [Phycisphaerae bacterium]|nr:phosphoribosylformylglycinamidine synthase subunit PurS [Phycisphaerae bacterium]